MLRRWREPALQYSARLARDRFGSGRGGGRVAQEACLEDVETVVEAHAVGNSRGNFDLGDLLGRYLLEDHA